MLCRAEMSTGLLVCERARGQHIEGHVSIQTLLVSAVDHAHSACADLFEKAVMPERLTDVRKC